jgi:hypothetical protein
MTVFFLPQNANWKHENIHITSAAPSLASCTPRCGPRNFTYSATVIPRYNAQSSAQMPLRSTARATSTNYRYVFIAARRPIDEGPQITANVKHPSGSFSSRINVIFDWCKVLSSCFNTRCNQTVTRLHQQTNGEVSCVRR